MNMNGRGGDDDAPTSSLSRKRTYSAMAESHRDSQGSAASTSTAAERGGPSDSLFIPQDDHYENEHAARRLRLTLPPLRRFEGDAFDFRRPTWASEATRSPVVDLTEEDAQNGYSEDIDHLHTARQQSAAGPSNAQRPPRFSVDVVTLDDSDGEQGSATHGPQRRHPYDPPPRTRPHLSILRRPESRRRPTAQPRDQGSIGSRPPSVSRRGPRSVTPYPVDGDAGVIDLTEDDDVIITESRSRRGAINSGSPIPTAGVGTRIVEDPRGQRPFESLTNIADFLHRPDVQRLRARMDQGGAYREIQARNAHRLALQQQQQRMQQRPPRHQHHREHDHVSVQQGFGALGGIMARIHGGLFGMPELNYDGVGFDYGLPGANRPTEPKYSPPPEPEEGFTRNPTEDEVVVCPNCGDELAVGGDEGKETMWIIKSCGHAYCGACTEHRGRSLKTKGKDRAADEYLPLPPPFRKCVIEGCGKPAGRTSMIRVYSG